MINRIRPNQRILCFVFLVTFSFLTPFSKPTCAQTPGASSSRKSCCIYPQQLSSFTGRLECQLRLMSEQSGAVYDHKNSCCNSCHKYDDSECNTASSNLGHHAIGLLTHPHTTPFLPQIQQFRSVSMPHTVHNMHQLQLLLYHQSQFCRRFPYYTGALLPLSW